MNIRFLNGLVALYTLGLVAKCGELRDDGEIIDLYKLYEEHIQRQKDEKLRADHT